MSYIHAQIKLKKKFYAFLKKNDLASTATPPRLNRFLTGTLCEK